MKAVDLNSVAAASEPMAEMSLGFVGGVAQTANYARIESGRLLVEVTLQPSGEQVVATVDTGGDECAFYLPLTYGTRVLVGWPGGDGAQPVIIARLNDGDGAFPALGVPTASPGRAPLYAALRTGDGQLLLIESGADSDVIVYSGGSAQVRVDSGDQILVSGRTHIGQSAQFAEDPTGACVADAGGVELGQSAEPYEPDPAAPQGGPIPPVLPPGSSTPVPVPADGLIRVKDAILSNNGVDSAFWSWLLGFVNVLLTWTPVANDGGAALKLAMAQYILANPVPTSLASEHRSGSLNTASDT